MKKILLQIVSAGLGLWLATLAIPGVVQVSLLPDSNFFGIGLTALWQIYLILAIALGLLNYFVKPVLKLIALPLEIITLGAFSIIISMGMIWAVSVIFDELAVPLFMPLFWTSFIIWICNFILDKILVKED